MQAAQNAPSTAWGACTKIVEAATKNCAPPQSEQPAQNWDAMATSFASLSAAFAWGSIILAIVAIVAAIAWGWFVKGWAEREAQKEAKQCADAYIRAWLVNEAPTIVRRHVEYLKDATVGGGSDTEAADEIGRAAG